jgi:hypothetical protein
LILYILALSNLWTGKETYSLQEGLGPNISSSGGLGAEKHLGTRINIGRIFAAPEGMAAKALHTAWNI